MSETIIAKYEAGVLVPQEHLDLQEHQMVHLQIIPPQVRVTATQARRVVNRFLLDKVSYLMGAARPTLIQSDRLVWRVPVVLTYPDQGEVGEVGCVDVDAEHGHILSDPQVIEELQNRAHALGSSRN
jgi:predicted DNA-binding antitoxin AbrB/MazE fold protein